VWRVIAAQVFAGIINSNIQQGTTARVSRAARIASRLGRVIKAISKATKAFNDFFADNAAKYVHTPPSPFELRAVPGLCHCSPPPAPVLESLRAVAHQGFAAAHPHTLGIAVCRYLRLAKCLGDPPPSGCDTWQVPATCQVPR
jgi:hypothetical protein